MRKKIVICTALAILVGLGMAYVMKGDEYLERYKTESRVFVTGGIHGKIDLDKLNEEYFPEQKELDLNDNLIIVGDFGLVWDKNIEDELILDDLDKKGFKILFVDGAHENFDLLSEYEIVELYGGKARRVRNNVYQLMRGEVYTISGKEYAVMGGGISDDKSVRTLGESYWHEEEPSESEWQNFNVNLGRTNNYVDYILTYSPPSSDLRMIGANIGRNLGKGNDVNKMLQNVADNVKYKRWYHSYYHLDMELSKKNISIYNKIVELK